MVNLFLGMIFMAAAVVAFFVPRAGLILGTLLLVTGLLPGLWAYGVPLLGGARPDENAGLLMMTGLYFLSAPGVMLVALSLLFGLRSG